MSTAKQETVLTDGKLFYNQEKDMVALGDGKPKVYASLNAAAAAARMIAKSNGDLSPLTPIALDDARNGVVTKMQADSENALKEGAKQAAKETSEEVLAAKETREFAEMLQTTYGHIVSDKATQEKIHLFTLSPVSKRIDFNADYIRSLLTEYDNATKDAIIPANKLVLINQINVEQAKLETFKTALDEDAFEYVALGIKAKIAPLQTQLSELPDENKTIFDALFLLPLCGRLFSEKALKPSTRGHAIDAPVWTSKLLALVYTSHRKATNGLQLNLDNASCLIYSHDHENVADLSIPEGKLAVANHEHVLIGTIDEKQALGNIQGQALWLIAPDKAAGQEKFVQAVASTGVDSFRSSKSTDLFKTAKVVAAIIRDGQHSELETVGNRSDTEKDHAPITE